MKMKNERKKLQPFLTTLLGSPHTVLLALFLFFICAAAPPAAHADEISAKAAVVIDGKTGKILFAKNPNLKHPPASTTKLMTAMVVLDRISPDDLVTISDNASKTPTVSPRLRKGERLTVRDLLYLTLMRSVNSAAVALAEKTAGSEEEFALLMNAKARQIDAENTHFANASGLPGGEQAVTAYELTRIMKEALTYPLIREIINTRVAAVYTQAGRKLPLKNTNHLLWEDDALLGGKTGYTRAARHCFVSAAEKDNTLYIVALLGETARGELWEETSYLLKKGNDVVQRRTEPMIYFSSVQDKPVVLANYSRTQANRTKMTQAQPRKAGLSADKKTAKASPKNKTADTSKKKKKSKKATPGKASPKPAKKQTALFISPCSIA